jgi:peptidoglycan hydrolase-like protein with peptidoglycan-binding domain
MNPDIETSEVTVAKKKPFSWLRWIITGLVVIAAIIAGNQFQGERNSAVELTGQDALNYAEVVITNLVQEETYSGTLGTTSSQLVKSQLSGTITEIPLPGETINQGEALYAINNQPVILLYGDLPAYRNFTIGEETISIPSQLTGMITWVAEPGTVIQQGDVLYRVDDQPVTVLYGNIPAYRDMTSGYFVHDPLPNDQDNTRFVPIAQTGEDSRQLEQALIDLGYDLPLDQVTYGNNSATRRIAQMIWNWQRDLGTTVDGIVHLGEVIFFPGPAQVLEIITLPGDQADGWIMTVSTGEPASGPDVIQLETALETLGFDAAGSMVLDEFFSVETYQAVLDFQKAVGLEQDGILNIGEVAFLPGSLQVKNQLESSGGFVGPGSDILEVSLSEKMVRMNLPASDQGILSVGDSVLIEMPDNSEVPGTVEFVSQTAQAGLNEWDPKTFEVQIEFDDPSVAEGLDEAPVDVIVVSDSVEDVMAVPISALLALLEGGYAVELDTGGGNIVLIGVEVGFFGSNGLIQVISDQLQPGDRVIVP